MQKTNVGNILNSLILLVWGILILLNKNLEIKTIFIISLIIFVLKGLFEYIFSKEKSNLQISFYALITGLIFIFLEYTKEELALVFSFLVLLSAILITKIFKIESYQSKIIWEVELSSFLLYLFLGLFTCINLYYTDSLQYFVLGQFFVLIGIMEFARTYMIDKRVK